MKLFFIIIMFLLVSSTSYATDKGEENLNPPLSSLSSRLPTELLSTMHFLSPSSKQQKELNENPLPRITHTRPCVRQERTLSSFFKPLLVGKLPPFKLNISDSQRASHLKDLNDFMAQVVRKPERIVYIQKEGVRAVREGALLSFSDRRADILILINSCAYNGDKGVFWVEVTLVGPKGKGIRPILLSSSCKIARFLVYERELDNRFADYVQEQIQILKELNTHDLPRSNNPYLFSRYKSGLSLGSPMPITDESHQESSSKKQSSKDEEEKEKEYVMIEKNTIPPCEDSQGETPSGMLSLLPSQILTLTASLPDLPTPNLPRTLSDSFSTLPRLASSFVWYLRGDNSQSQSK